jgi:hypothetical protein
LKLCIFRQKRRRSCWHLLSMFCLNSKGACLGLAPPTRPDPKKRISARIATCHSVEESLVVAVQRSFIQSCGVRHMAPPQPHVLLNLDADGTRTCVTSTIRTKKIRWPAAVGFTISKRSSNEKALSSLLVPFIRAFESLSCAASDADRMNQRAHLHESVTVLHHHLPILITTKTT